LKMLFYREPCTYGLVVFFRVNPSVGKQLREGGGDGGKGRGTARRVRP